MLINLVDIRNDKYLGEKTARANTVVFFSASAPSTLFAPEYDAGQRTARRWTRMIDYIRNGQGRLCHQQKLRPPKKVRFDLRGRYGVNVLRDPSSWGARFEYADATAN